MGVSEIFKTEFKGYNKKEVIDYISSLNSQMENLKSELDRCESELEKCQSELAERENVAPAAQPEIDVEAVKREAYEQGRRDALASDSFAELEELRAKAQMYDNQRELIADIVIKAKSDAAQIYEGAEKSSKELLSVTFDKFEKAREDFVQMRKNVEAGKAEIDARIAAVSHYLNDFNQYLNILEKDIVNTGDNFKENI